MSTAPIFRNTFLLKMDPLPYTNIADGIKTFWSIFAEYEINANMQPMHMTTKDVILKDIQRLFRRNRKKQMGRFLFPPMSRCAGFFFPRVPKNYQHLCEKMPIWMIVEVLFVKEQGAVTVGV